MRMILIFCLISSLVVAGGCRGTDDSASDSLTVTASTTHTADFARNVIGDRGEVDQILSANADPHDYEPSPSDAQGLATADLVLKSGGDLDEWLDELIESSGTDATVVSLLDSIPPRAGPGGELDPHWWQDPRNVESAVLEIADELIAVDPEGEEEYRRNAEGYVAEVRKLDRAAQACIDSIPVEDRKLVTSHDALGYYADRYGIEVIGAVIPARTTQAQASAGEVARLVSLIRSSGVEAIFPESGVSGDLEQAVADDADAAVGGQLWADTLGPEGSTGETYLGALAANTETLVDGLTAGEESCEIDAGD